MQEITIPTLIRIMYSKPFCSVTSENAPPTTKPVKTILAKCQVIKELAQRLAPYTRIFFHI